MSAVGERPRGPPGPRDAPGGSPAPRRKILVRKVKRPEGSVATSQDGMSTRATSPARSRGDFGALSTLRFESAGPVTGRGGKATRPPPSAPGTPPEPATEAAVAPRGPRPGKRGKREEWTVLGDVGASRREADPPRPRTRTSRKARLFSRPESVTVCATLAERRLTRDSHSRKPRVSPRVSIRNPIDRSFQTSTNPCSRRRSRRSARSSRSSPSTCPTCPRTCTGSRCK